MISRILLQYLFITLTTLSMSAQKLNGSYRLQGVHDMASAFEFTPDGKFQYFYIYGVADRNATGTYTIEGNLVKLKSDKEAGKDFPIVSQDKKGKGYTIECQAPNPYLLSNIIAVYFIDSVQQVVESDNKGIIHIPENKVDKIYLQHQLFPDVLSLIKDESNPNNHFVVSLSPSLMGVSFKGIDLTIDGDTLTCLPNYFLPFENIQFVKE